MAKFSATLEPVSHGGHFVVVPAEAAKKAGLKHGARVRGTVNGAAYRSSLMKYSGIFHLGVHKATLAAAKVGPGETVQVTLELDDAPLPTDEVPKDLQRALGKVAKAAATWPKLAPSQRREYVKSVTSAKREETRASRIEKIVAALKGGVPARKTWEPKKK
jgi:hypothetical protein